MYARQRHGSTGCIQLGADLMPTVVLQLASRWRAAFNFTHRINRLSFGQDYPGLVNPLDGRDEYTREGMAIALLGRNCFMRLFLKSLWL